MQRVYKSIKKFKIMLDHRLRKQAWNVGCKVLKSNQSKILIDIMKCFKRWGVKYIFELSSNVIKYVMTKVRLKEAIEDEVGRGDVVGHVQAFLLWFEALTLGVNSWNVIF